MKRWDQRPFEIRNLFNPAFCGIVLFRALQGYEEENTDGIPFSLLLLVLPLCLQKDSRQVMAENPRRYLMKIIEDNPQLLVGFANRTSNMLPFTFEALGVLMERGCFVVTSNGRLKTQPNKVRKSVTGTKESISCQRVARFVGKEFARIADRATVYTTFGIRP
ncbi:three component ABC system middle component [Rahnella inusitata]|uniref:three component ABC system middle component n=1 Tax=Rahnella inusitata TaxID=58169 RepID=UPI0039BDD2AE